MKLIEAGPWKFRTMETSTSRMWNVARDVPIVKKIRY